MDTSQLDDCVVEKAKRIKTEIAQIGRGKNGHNKTLSGEVCYNRGPTGL